MQERIARRYGYRSPFDEGLVEDLKNPYRRAFLLESYNGIKVELHEILIEYLPEVMQQLVDVLGVSLLRAKGFKGSTIFSSKFRRRERRPKEKRPIKQTFIMDDGTVVHVV